MILFLGLSCLFVLSRSCVVFVKFNCINIKYGVVFIGVVLVLLVVVIVNVMLVNLVKDCLEEVILIFNRVLFLVFNVDCDFYQVCMVEMVYLCGIFGMFEVEWQIEIYEENVV